MYMTLDKGNLSKIPIAIYYGLIPSGRQRVNLFAAACDQAGMKISTKMTKLLNLSQMLQLSSNALQQIKKFKYLWVILIVHKWWKAIWGDWCMARQSNLSSSVQAL